MNKRKGHHQSWHNQVAVIGEGVKISVENALKLFLEDESITDYAFPSSLTSEERKFIHNFAPKHGLVTKSKGQGDRRYLTVYKQEVESLAAREATITLTGTSERLASDLLRRNPVTEAEQQELMPVTASGRYDRRNGLPRNPSDLTCTTGRLNKIVRQIPVPVKYELISREMLETRQSLPIAAFKETILETVRNNPVTLISGDTGCGKTTQVPQFIMEDCAEKGASCRILVAEPRRLAALSVAERVANERGEMVGQLVGYQIRLESKVSPRTLCTFCTNGVLLRTIMGGEDSLANVSHVIVDEVHERDRLSDLLVTVLKELLQRGPQKGTNFKLILMSATLNTEKFVEYFDGCPVIKVPGRMFNVDVHFLEDILKMTEYKEGTNDEFFKKDMRRKVRQQAKLLGWCTQTEEPAAAAGFSNGSPMEEGDTSPEVKGDPGDDLSPEIRHSVDSLLEEAWVEPTQNTFQDLLSLYINESVPINYIHSDTGITALISAAARGMHDFVEQFLTLGANVSIRTELNDWNAIEWAEHFNYDEIVELLTLYLDQNHEQQQKEADDVVKSKVLTPEETNILETYHRSFNDEEVDLKLIMCLLHHIFQESRESPKGAILVFLPGYEEIVNLRTMIMTEFTEYQYRYVLFTLHSQMQSSDHKRVFQSVPLGTRKVILATNIAETSVTIDDVVHVIDSGKVKEKSYDALMGVTTMQAVRISQANAVQRRGRAGRCQHGICYHLFSSIRFQSMQPFQVPEIMRTPAHELCLQVKLLAPGKPLAEFLSRLPDPPPATSIRNSISLLKAIDALDENENLTELGLLLLDLPIEPHLGKVVLHAVSLKCLDPVLTIVCSITYKDPFLIPSNPAMKHAANKAKMRLSMNSLSDHLILLKAFQGWQRAKSDNYERRYCADNFISPSTMEMIFGLRTQLLGQLRASGFVRAHGANDIRDLNSHSENWAVVKAALSAGYFPNVIRVDREKKHRLMSRKEASVFFHPSSALSHMFNRGKDLDDIPSDWLIYEEMSRITRHSFARLCTVINPLTIAIFCGPSRLPLDACVRDDRDEDTDSEEEVDRQKPRGTTCLLKIDDWVSFRLSPDVASLVCQLRVKWQSLFLRRLCQPQKMATPLDADFIKNLGEILCREEQEMGIDQPIGVGVRPIPMSTSFCSPVESNALTFDQIQSRNHHQMTGPSSSQWSTASMNPYQPQQQQPPPSQFSNHQQWRPNQPFEGRGRRGNHHNQQQQNQQYMPGSFRRH